METVGSLIEKLRQFDATMRVVVGGYDECGFDNVETVETIIIKPYKRANGFCGEFYEAAQGEGAETAVLINF
jgi:hypothetical protein